jgi:Cellulase (glycosyl hydrolase family 5)
LKLTDALGLENNAIKIKMGEYSLATAIIMKHFRFRTFVIIPALTLLLTSCTHFKAESSPSISIKSSASIRGAIYIPAGAFNAPQLWKNFNLAETRRDFGYAKEIHLNALRIWASYEYWQMEPEKFQTSLNELLAAAHDAGIRILISLFEEDGVPPTSQNIWDTNPATAFDIRSPGFKITKDRKAWGKPRSFLKWFMEHYRNDNRLLAIEVMNEPNGVEVPFAKSMFKTAKSMQGTVPLTIGSDSVEHALQYIPLGLDVIEFHYNFPTSRDKFEAAITNALAVSHKYNLPVWLTEWQRLRPGGNGWGKKKISETETTPDYASLAPIVHQYPIGNFFWSLMVKYAYLPSQRHQGTINGLFWPDGSVWSLADARAIAEDPSLNLPQKQTLPPGYLDYLTGTQ